MKNVTLVMTKEAKEVMTQEFLLELEQEDTIDVSGEMYSSLRWENVDDYELDEIKEVFFSLSALDVQYLYVLEDYDNTTVGGNEFEGILSWYKEFIDIFSIREDKVVLIKNSIGDVLKGFLVDQRANPTNAILKAKQNAGWDVDQIIEEWKKEEMLFEIDVESFHI